MNSEKLLKTAVDALEDIKGYDIDVINVAKITSLFEYIVIASADSTRQAKSLARNVEEKPKQPEVLFIAWKASKRVNGYWWI